jgi:hypothetical protein
MKSKWLLLACLLACLLAIISRIVTVALYEPFWDGITTSIDMQALPLGHDGYSEVAFERLFVLYRIGAFIAPIAFGVLSLVGFLIVGILFVRQRGSKKEESR